MKKENLSKILICVFVFAALIIFAFVNTDQTPTGNGVSVGNYAQVATEEAAVEEEAAPEEATDVVEEEETAAEEEAVVEEAAEENTNVFLTKVSEINGWLNSNIAWGLFMCILLVGTGLLISLRTGFIQFRHFGYIMKNTIGKMFDKSQKTNLQKGELTPFQALCTALAATVGTGNIAGVTGAIVIGGPGAVFWMWVAALMGMCTKYAEIVLSVKYREKNAQGEWVGGPMYYIKNGLGEGFGWLATMFALFGSIAAFGIGAMTQTNTISSTMVSAIDSVTSTVIAGTATETYLRWIIGVIIALLIGMVILGGIKRLGSVTERIVPFMSLLYVIGALVVIVANIGNIGMVFASIFRCAFTGEAVIGGVGGFMFMTALKKGVGRGVFSNEAGLGSAPIAHASTSETDPVKQGLYGVFEVFADTIVICTLTALVVLCSNVVPWGNSDMAGAATTILAFGTVFGQKFSSIFIAISILFFAFSTALSWSLYGSRCFGYLTKEKGVKVYQLVYMALVVIGSTMNLALAWDIADTLNGFMAIPNLVALLALSGTVVKLTRDHFSKELK